MTSASQNSVTLAAEETAFRRILSDQVVRYPWLEVQDLYKLIYQAGMGSEHACQDIVAARTANEFEGTLANLRRYWSYAERMAAEEELPFTGIELGDFFSKMEGNRFPKVHHSKAYKAAYHPAYRVIVRGFLLW